MLYKRKTQDEFQLHVNYGYGWEHETSESSRKDAKRVQREYRENSPEYATKIIIKRVKREHE